MQVPKFVRFVESMPMTVSGKVQKFVLRDQSNAALGLSDIAMGQGEEPQKP